MLGSVSNFHLDLSHQLIKFKMDALEKMMILHFSVSFYVVFHYIRMEIRNYQKCESHFKTTSPTPISELADTIINHLPHQYHI